MLKKLTKPNDYELLRDVMVDILVGSVAIRTA